MEVFADPEQAALLFVQQYLKENQHDAALASLEASSTRKYNEEKLPQGGMLMQLVWDAAERVAADDNLGGSAEAVARAAEEEELMRGGEGDFCAAERACVAGVHPANCTCVRPMLGTDDIVTGAGDGAVRRVTSSGELLWTCHVSHGGVLSIHLRPESSEGGPSMVLSGSMDGSIAFVDARSGMLLASQKVHNKYVVKVLWVLDGQSVVSGSHDQTVMLHHVTFRTAAGKLEPQLELVHKVHYGYAVCDVAVLRDGVTAVTALRDTNYLRVWDLHKPKEEKRANLNAFDDDHVSFSARHLAPSPCGRYLLVATDVPRIIAYRLSDWTQVRNFYGLVMEKFHNPCALWHRDSYYVYALAAAGAVFVYHVGSARLVARVPAHAGNVRDMAYDPDRNLLFTCSYDKTVKVWQASSE